MSIEEIAIGLAAPEDLPAIAALLVEQQLPIDGLELVASLWVARAGTRIIGSIGLEFYADGALLRSAAVASGLQSRGIGRSLIETALASAQSRRAPAVYLLTTTAERYFPRFGFEVITRADIPEGIRASVEFTSACPASAIVMRRRLAV